MRVRVAELTAKPELHVAAVAQPEQVQPGLDAVDEEPASEILEPRTRRDRARQERTPVHVAQDEPASCERRDPPPRISARRHAAA